MCFSTLLSTFALSFLESSQHILVVPQLGALLTANFQIKEGENRAWFMYVDNLLFHFYPTLSFRGPPKRVSVDWINRWESSQISGKKADRSSFSRWEAGSEKFSNPSKLRKSAGIFVVWRPLWSLCSFHHYTCHLPRLESLVEDWTPIIVAFSQWNHPLSDLPLMLEMPKPLFSMKDYSFEVRRISLAGCPGCPCTEAASRFHWDGAEPTP